MIYKFQYNVYTVQRYPPFLDFYLNLNSIDFCTLREGFVGNENSRDDSCGGIEKQERWS